MEEDKEIWIMHCVDRYVPENCDGWTMTLACEQCEQEYESQKVD